MLEVSDLAVVELGFRLLSTLQAVFSSSYRDQLLVWTTPTGVEPVVGPRGPDYRPEGAVVGLRILLSGWYDWTSRLQPEEVSVFIRKTACSLHRVE